MEDRLRILLCEDDENLGMLLREYLQAKGYNADLFADGESGYKAFLKGKYDLCVLDVMMPKKDGFTLAQEIRNVNGDVPIIFLTAKALKEDVLEGFKLGADDYITKPFNLDVLWLRMKKLVELTSSKTHRGLIDPEPDEIKITPLDEKFIEKAVNYVSDNIDRSDLSVEELSDKLGMSRVRLYKKIKQITGKTPIEFIRVIRLKRAAQLLRESQLNISEIAYQTGFNNPKVFSKYFKEEFGVLPSIYQENEGRETNYTI